MNFDEPRTKLNNYKRRVSEISFNSRANLRQSELSEMHWVSHGMCENEMHLDLSFEAKQIQFTMKFHCII